MRSQQKDEQRSRSPFRVRLLAALLGALAVGTTTNLASAQYPPPGQPYPQQPYPPPQQQPYPQQYPQPYPQQYPQQPYPPPQGQPQYPPQGYPPPGYGQQPQPLPSPFPAPAPVQQPPRPPPSRYRSPGEMLYLYGASAAYGFGTGMWIDAMANITDPGIWVITPVALGVAVPVGMYLWDYNSEFDRGVPSSMATGVLLGGVEGIAISGLQWQLTGGASGGSSQWHYSTWTTVTFLTATGGGIGGYAFGEWLQPDPRSLGFIASGAGWGSIFGILFGAGIVNGDWKDGSAVWGFAGYNAGMAAAGALSTVYTPSWESLKYMWLGDLLGTIATTPVYLFYIGSGANPRHGLIANSLGGLAGIGVAAALTANMTDSPDTAKWMPPFQLAVAPTYGGAQLTAAGSW